MTYNDGTEIDLSKIDQTTQELSDKFEGLTQDLVKIHGSWKFKRTLYFDKLLRIRIDTRDPKAREFFKEHKEIWKKRLQQLDLWITVHEVEVI